MTEMAGLEITAEKVLKLWSEFRIDGHAEVLVAGTFRKVARVRMSESGADLVWVEYRTGDGRVKVLPVAPSATVEIR